MAADRPEEVICVLLATRQDVADRLRVALDAAPDDETLRPLIDEASVMTEGYLRRTFTTSDPPPHAVAIVVSRMVARRIDADGDDVSEVPDGVSSLGATDFSASFAEPFVSMGTWLNKTDKAMLARYRNATQSFSVSSDRTPRCLPDWCDDENCP